MQPTFWIVGFLILMAGGIALSLYLERKRREVFAALAKLEGLEYQPEKHPPQLPFELFDRGHSRYARHRFSGSLPEAIAGLDAVMLHRFEYHYAVTTGSGKQRRTQHYYHRCALIEAGLDLGQVVLAPEGIGERVAQFFGRQDIDLDDVDFSRRVAVRSPSPKQAYGLLGRELMAWWPRTGDWHLEADGQHCLIYQTGSLKPENLAELRRMAVELLERLPRTLVNEERVRRGLPPSLQAGVAASRNGSAGEAQPQSGD